MSSSLDSYYDQRSSAHLRQQALEEKIDRLRKARSDLSGVKSDAKDNKKVIHDQDDDTDLWTGHEHDIYLDDKERLVNDYKYYIDEIEDVRDDLQDEIRRLDSQLGDTEQLIRELNYKISLERRSGGR